MKTFLVPYSGDQREDQALKFALSLGKGVNAVVDVVHISSDPQVVLANAYAGVGMAMPSMDRFIKDIVEKNQDTKKNAFDKVKSLCDERSITLTENTVSPTEESVILSHHIGKAEQYVPVKGRVHDLIIMGSSIQGAGVAYENVLLTTLFSSGRPLLIVPSELKNKGSKIESIAVAWNGSSEATKAVVASLPLLRNVEKVFILSEERGTHSEKPNAMELICYLKQHGIEAENHSINVSGSSAGAVIAEKAVSLHADILVMGAFTHNRLRQMIMGGVTTFMMDHAPLPVLMVH